MALKGTLKDFSVSDIFQLIGQQQKSGSLYVRAKEEEARIVFDKGCVLLGTFRNSKSDFLLGTMLLRARAISVEQLNEAIQNQKTSLRSLGDILISMGAISPTTLSEFTSLQLQEVLFHLFQWKEGMYEFVPETLRYNRSVIKPHTSESILMESFRMLDEWPSIQSKIGSFESVFRALVDPETLKEKTSEEDSTPEKVTSQEKKILQCLDGQNSLQEVIYLSRLGTFETCRMVAELMDRGLALKMATKGSPTKSEDSLHPSSFRAWLLWAYPPLLLLLLLAGLLPIIAFKIPSHWSLRYGKIHPVLGRTYAPQNSLQTLQERNQRKFIQLQLKIYQLEHGQFPSLLETLNLKGIAANWEYESNGETYSLFFRPAS